MTENTERNNEHCQNKKSIINNLLLIFSNAFSINTVSITDNPWPLFFLSITVYSALSIIFVLSIIFLFFIIDNLIPGISLPKLSDTATTASTIIQATFAAAVVFGASMAVVAYASRAERLAKRQTEAHIRMSSIVGIQAVASAIDIVKTYVDSEISVMNSAEIKIYKITSYPAIIINRIQESIEMIKKQPIDDTKIDSLASIEAKNISPIAVELISSMIDILHDITRIINLPVSGNIAVERICDNDLIDKIKRKIESGKDTILCCLFQDHIINDVKNHKIIFSPNIDSIIKGRFGELIGLLVSDLSRSIRNNATERQIKTIITLGNKCTEKDLNNGLVIWVCGMLCNNEDCLIMRIIANYYRYSPHINHDAYIKFIKLSAKSLNIGYDTIETDGMASSIENHLMSIYNLDEQPKEREPELIGFFCG